MPHAVPRPRRDPAAARDHGRRAYLRSTSKRYDVIAIDIPAAVHPFQVTTREFFVSSGRI
jgi:hypothetical protein